MVNVILSACSLVGFWTCLDWLMLVYCERETLLAGWFGLAETNEQTGCICEREEWTGAPGVNKCN